jgi:hypothetical protein
MGYEAEQSLTINKHEVQLRVYGAEQATRNVDVE